MHMGKPIRKAKKKLSRRIGAALDGHKLQILAVTAGAGMLAERVAYNALARGWRAVRGEEPPGEPEHPDVEWREALVWTAITGVTMALVGMAARRGAAAGYERARTRFA